MNVKDNLVPDELLQAREEQWEQHPVISTSAVLPTGPIGWVISLVFKHATRQRSSLAFWAHPLTGKSSCIEALETVLRRKVPGCGILVHEAKTNTTIAEGTFISDILFTVDYEPKIHRGLAEKRDQLRRALFALAAGARHLFIIIDEAQSLHGLELEWLKEYINWLIRRRYKVTVILFGQSELIDKRDSLISEGRSDLNARFTDNLSEFEPIGGIADVRPVLRAMDNASEFPAGSGWSYTQFLWPRAWAAGFRIESQLDLLWRAFGVDRARSLGSEGVGMNYIAIALAEFAWDTRERDSEGFAPTLDDWRRAVELSGYLERAPMPSRPEAGAGEGKGKSGSRHA